LARRYISLSTTPPGEVPGQVLIRCPGCGETTPAEDLRAHALVCPWCDFHFPLEAAPRLDGLVDEGSFRPLAPQPAGPALFGRATLLGRPVALAVADPMTSWSPAEALALVALAEEALQERLPLLWVVSAFHGTVAESPWPGVQAALSGLSGAGLPWIALLAGPCYGPPSALALQADLVLAEPGATLALLLPEVLHQAGRLPPESKESPQHLLRAGWADAVVSRQEQRPALAGLLDLLGIEGKPLPRFHAAGGKPAGQQAPGTLQRLFDPFFELHGDRGMADDPALVGGLARLRGHGARLLVLAAGLGQERRLVRRPHNGAVGAAGWRKATRLLHLAARFGLPVVTLVGAPTLRAGRRDRPDVLAATLGQTLQALVTLPVPVVAVRLGSHQGFPTHALSTSDGLLVAEPFAAHLQQEGPAPDATFADEQELLPVLGQQLDELTQTYAVHGPLGRRKLLQRRYVRWARLSPPGDMDLPQE